MSEYSGQYSQIYLSELRAWRCEMLAADGPRFKRLSIPTPGPQPLTVSARAAAAIKFNSRTSVAGLVKTISMVKLSHERKGYPFERSADSTRPLQCGMIQIEKNDLPCDLLAVLHRNERVSRIPSHPSPPALAPRIFRICCSFYSMAISHGSRLRSDPPSLRPPSGITV